ncbi:hypothetical protein [Saccharothrix australiensis]|uniref:Signal transduction histidine kinase n=1 Tax=Saccharothrix australiensis TaxID=2072 RepID=A0A495W229_9PSEU|nr:hypothetical protein [Saccharothrix australiensis]RKT54775.1 hypothetical protein C8E97_3424 [Saccharothrix australiensis]
MADHSAWAAGQVFTAMRLVVFVVTAVVQFGLGVVPLLAYDHGPGAPVASGLFTLVLVVIGWWVVRRRALPPPVVAVAVVVELGASALANAALPPGGHFAAPHWSFGLVGWHLLLLLPDRVGLLLAALAAHVGLSVGQFALAETLDRAALGGAGVVVLSTTSFQLGVLVIAHVLRRNARRAAEVAHERERAAVRAALAEQWADDLRAGFAGRLGATLPLLADLADGVLDPRDPDARRRCALAATQLRRLFAEDDDVPDPLVNEVAACVDVAERRGVAVSLAVSGEASPVPTEVRRALTWPVAAALAAARSTARVSLLRAAGEVRVAVLADAPVEVGAVSELVEVESDTHGGRTRTEARWRS